ncbi:MAG: imelysin family protein [Hyphomicrobiales bacterium]|nr:imelysin family protein [Hyphomicrobiales bacterium]
MIKVHAGLAVAGLTALLSATPASTVLAFDAGIVTRQALEGHIRPGYGRLADAFAQLETAFAALCKSPSEPALAQVDTAYRAAVVAWGGVEHLRFGPVAEKNRYERIAFWPDPKGIGRRQVARAMRKRDPSLQDVERLSKKSVALQGLTALELVLHGKGRDTLKTADEAGKTADEAGAFRCSYGETITRNLSAISREIVEAWSPDGAFAKLWLSVGPENPVYRSAQEAARELVRTYIDGLESVHQFKIRASLGLGPDGPRRKRRAAFSRSGLAVALITANAAGLRDLFVDGGLADQLSPEDPGLAVSIRGELDRAVEVAQTIAFSKGMRLAEPAVEEKLLLMGFPLANARETAGDLLADAVGLPIRFTDSDAN